jgi:hypothetical protein
VCNGATATTQNCPNGCTNGRGCNQCTGNGVQCVNGNTVRRCVNGFFQDQFCAQGCNAGATQCNNCTGNATSCTTGTTQQQCVNGQFVNTNCPQGCVAGRCASCNQGQCSGNSFRACTNGQLAAAVTCTDTDRNPCVGAACNAATGCTTGNVPAGTSCADTNPCNGTETCSGGFCNDNPDLSSGTACGGGNVCDRGSCVAPAPPANPCATTNCNAVLSAAQRECSTGTTCLPLNGVAQCTAIPAGAGQACTTSTGTAGGTCTGNGAGSNFCQPPPCNERCIGNSRIQCFSGVEQPLTACPAGTLCDPAQVECVACIGTNVSNCPFLECATTTCFNGCRSTAAPSGRSCNTANGSVGTCNGFATGVGACTATPRPPQIN